MLIEVRATGFDQGLVGPVRSVEHGFEVCWRYVAKVAVPAGVVPVTSAQSGQPHWRLFSQHDSILVSRSTAFEISRADYDRVGHDLAGDFDRVPAAVEKHWHSYPLARDCDLCHGAGRNRRAPCPRTVSTCTPARVEARIVAIRPAQRQGTDATGAELGTPPRTVSRVLVHHGIPALRSRDPMTGQLIRTSKTTAVR